MSLTDIEAADTTCLAAFCFVYPAQTKHGLCQTHKGAAEWQPLCNIIGTVCTIMGIYPALRKIHPPC